MSIIDQLFGNSPSSDTDHSFIRELRDVGNVRIMRLQGNVGKEIGGEVKDYSEQAEREQAIFDKSILFDFADAVGSDFSTVSFLVKAVSNRIGTSARVGIINAPTELIAALEIAKLSNMFTIFNSEKEALAALNR